MELTDIELAIPPASTAEPQLFRSRFGGLWTDRRDAHDVLAQRRARGEVTDAEAETLSHYIDHGYVVFPGATDPELIDRYLALFERAWDEPPSTIYLHWQRQVLPMSRRFYDEVSKVSDLHCYFDLAGELIFPPLVLRFLEQIFERPPVVFQTMSMRKGSEETLHIDTGPLTLTEPLSMAASWVALEDVQPCSGEFEFVPGSHRLPELLHYGVEKGHSGDFREYAKILNRTLEMCAERGLETKRFMAKKGDVLIWHADLMHGGAKIEDAERTRKSLVAHFMPLGVMPTFYDFSDVNALRYPTGGHCLDRLLRDTAPKRQASPQGDGKPPPAPDGWTRLKAKVPLPVRAFIRKRISR